MTDRPVDTRRREFGAALGEALNIRRTTQIEVAQALGTTQSTISSWKIGDSAPEPDTVFKLEAILELPPGWLSRHLGYQPNSAIEGRRKERPLREVIVEDPLLSDDHKRLLLAMVTEMTANVTRAGRRPKRT